MAYVNFATRKKGQNTVAIGNPYIKTLSGLNDPSEYGLEGLANFTNDQADTAAAGADIKATEQPRITAYDFGPDIAKTNADLAAADLSRAQSKYELGALDRAYGQGFGMGLTGTNPFNLPPSTGGTPNVAPAAPEAAPAGVAGPPNPYIVKPGDTLGKIAETIGGGYSKFPSIARLNNLPNPNLIIPGQKLNIPGYGAPTAPTTQTAATTPTVPTAPTTSAPTPAAGQPDTVMVNGQPIDRTAAENFLGFKPAPPTFEQQLQMEGVKNDWRTRTAEINAGAKVDAAQIAADAKVQALLSQKKEGGGLTDEAIKGLAEYVKITGTIPPLGMGAAAAADRQRIFNAAFGGQEPGTAQPDFSGSDMAGNKARFGAGTTALNALERQRNLALSFEKTANKNADLALGISNRVDRTGSPVVNRLLLKVRGQYAGDPDVAALEAAVKTFANEYAKVTTGQTGGAAVSDSARQEIDRLINAAQTPGQFEAVIRLMQSEMRNRAQGYEEQYNQLLGNMPTAGGQANDPLGLR